MHNIMEINKLDRAITSVINTNDFSKINPPKLIKLLCGMLTDESPSYRDIATEYALKFGQKITKQSFCNFFQNHLVDILLDVIKSLLIEENNIDIDLSCYFNRILLHDSTTVKLPENASKVFDGLSKGKGCKIQAYYDLLNSNFVELDITPFNINDQKYSHEIMNVLLPGDLIVRDLGYFSSDELLKISKESYFLTKIQTTTTFFDEHDEEVDLLELLKRNTNIDQILYMTAKNKVKVRIIASKLPHEVANKRRQKKKADKKSNPSKRSLEILGWNILATNVFDENINPEILFNLYKLRWKIEIIFKTWKSFCNFTNFHERISETQINAYLLIRLLNVIISNKIITSPLVTLISKDINVSYLSLIKYTFKYFNQLLEINNIEELYNLMNIIIQYSKHEKRSNKTNLIDIELTAIYNLKKITNKIYT